MGIQSSLYEAQVNALKTSLQVLTWTVASVLNMMLVGLQVGRILLFPSITAVVIGWVGREVVANIISGLVLNLTQPFAQGDWITLDGNDGWVQAISLFYTRIVQWDKRPLYIPNYKVMSMKVQNNSRMTHRRVMFELPLRLRDIPKIPQIVKDIQDMICEHEDVDTVQHRLVRWRSIGEYSANIWVSCYTHPTVDGIRLGIFTSVQQSVLERCSAIVYKHGADFASTNDRYGLPSSGSKDPIPNFAEQLFDRFQGAQLAESREQLESREQVLRQREKEMKQREKEMQSFERNLKDAAARQRAREQEFKEREDRLLQLLEQEAEQKAASVEAHAAKVAATAAVAAAATSSSSGSSSKDGAPPPVGSKPQVAVPVSSDGKEGVTDESMHIESAPDGYATEAQAPPAHAAAAGLSKKAAAPIDARSGNTPEANGQHLVDGTKAPPGHADGETKAQVLVSKAAAGGGDEHPPAAATATTAGSAQDEPIGDSDGGSSAVEGETHAQDAVGAKTSPPPSQVHDGEELHDSDAENTRIPVKEMGD